MEKIRKPQLATDYYQLSAGNVYMIEGLDNKTAVFDMFIRKNPFEGGYTVFAGLEQVIEYIQNLSFTGEDIDMLKKNHPELAENFLEYLRCLKFEGEIYAPREGTIVFPQEPLIRVKAPLIQAQLIETSILTIINHQSLIATKASRVRTSAKNDVVLDFGMRRAHGMEAGLYGARAAIIGGCNGTSNVEAEYRFGSVSKGTMSHAYIMSFKDEYTAFEAFAKYNPGNVVLLIDTYDTIGSGIVNAVKLFKNLAQNGKLTGLYGVRLDSGDLAYLTKKVRKILDEAGLQDAKISASSDLDEYLIADLKAQGAQINLWGVGTKMITADGSPSLGGVYKMSQIADEDGSEYQKMKISDDPFKITNPGYKKIFRFYDRATNKAEADLIALEDEVIDDAKPLKIYHPYFTYKQRLLRNFYAKELLHCIFKDGQCVYESPTLQDIAAFHEQEKASFWEEFIRFQNPSEYHVDISDRLYDIKSQFIREHTVR